MSRLGTHYLCKSSERLDLGLEEEVIDMEGDVGNSEDKNLDSEQEYLARDEL